jgi:hypothetical protein
MVAHRQTPVMASPSQFRGPTDLLPLRYSPADVKPAPIWIWRWCSTFSTLLFLPFIFISWRIIAKVGSNAIRNIGRYRYVYYGMIIVGTGIVLCQVVNAAFLNLFWIFFLGIAFQLCGGILQFVRMILLPPHESEPDRR